MSGNEIVITETEGDERSITLRGRSMPDTKQEPLSLSLQQRGRVNYPPWQPVADVSILGATWKPTTISGLWDDKYMGANDAPLLAKFKNLGSRGPTGISTVNGRARNCVEIYEALAILLRTGQTLKFEWGQFVRYGILWIFDAEWYRLERVSWTMEFEWVGDSKIKPKVKARPKLSPLSLLELLLRILEALRKAIQLLNAPAKFYANNILAPFKELTSAISDAINEITKVVANAITPAKVLGDLRAQFTKIKLACKDLLRALQKQVGYDEPLGRRDAALADYGLLFLRKEVVAAAAAMAERELALSKLDTPELQDLVKTVSGETLRDVAKRIYGSAADWLIIARYNGFASAMVPENTLVLVPSKAAA